jgi:hypothetical protein
MTVRDIIKAGGEELLSHYDNSLYKALEALYPEHQVRYLLLYTDLTLYTVEALGVSSHCLFEYFLERKRNGTKVL